MAIFLPKKYNKEVISIRIDTQTLDTIDKKAGSVGISRNEFITQCIEFALDNMEDETPQPQ